MKMKMSIDATQISDNEYWGDCMGCDETDTLLGLHNYESYLCWKCYTGDD